MEWLPAMAAMDQNLWNPYYSCYSHPSQLFGCEFTRGFCEFRRGTGDWIVFSQLGKMTPGIRPWFHIMGSTVRWYACSFYMHRHISVIIHAYMHTSYMYISYRTYINIYIYLGVSQTLFLRAVRFFLRFLYDFLIQCSKQGTAWLLTVAVQRRGCYKSLKWILEQNPRTCSEVKNHHFSMFRRTRSFSLNMATWLRKKPPMSITAT